jgi:hypothetical protein
MTPKQQLLLEIEQAPEAAIDLLLDLLRSLKRLLPTSPEEPEPLPPPLNAQPLDVKEIERIEAESGLPSFFQTLNRLHAEIPESEWAKIPSDLSMNLDYYLYGGLKDEEEEDFC